MFGTLGAAWPLIRDDLGLTYAEIGLALAVPGFVGSALDPVIGVLATPAGAGPSWRSADWRSPSRLR